MRLESTKNASLTTYIEHGTGVLTKCTKEQKKKADTLGKKSETVFINKQYDYDAQDS